MPINTDVQAAARSAIEEMVHRETRAWDQQDADAMVALFHPDMVWPRPPTAQDHDPESWLLPMRRFDRDRWKRSWEQLFAMHRLVHNRRALRKVMVSAEGDGGARALEPARCFESLSLPSLPSHPLVEQEGAAVGLRHVLDQPQIVLLADGDDAIHYGVARAKYAAHGATAQLIDNLVTRNLLGNSHN